MPTAARYIAQLAINKVRLKANESIIIEDHVKIFAINYSLVSPECKESWMDEVMNGLLYSNYFSRVSTLGHGFCNP